MKLERRYKTVNGIKKTRSLILESHSERESRMLDQAFGSRVGYDGLIFEGKLTVIRKLSDGYAKDYLEIKLLEEENVGK